MQSINKHKCVLRQLKLHFFYEQYNEKKPYLRAADKVETENGEIVVFYD